MLTLWAPQAESLWDESLPVEVKELPADLAELDRVLSDPELMMVLLERWRQEVIDTGRGVDRGPTDDRDGDLREVDGLEGALSVGVPDVDGGGLGLDPFAPVLPDLAVGASAGRLDGAQADAACRRRDGERVDPLADRGRGAPEAVPPAGGEDRFDRRGGGRALSDRRGPRLARGRVLAREGRKLAALVKERKASVRDRSRAMGRKLRALTRTIRRRSGEAKREVLELTEQAGELLERSVKAARRVAKAARGKARGRGANMKVKAAAELEELADRCEKVAAQIRQRINGEPIKDRLVSLLDPDARPIRKGKLGKPNEFGFVTQFAEVTEHTKRGARDLLLPRRPSWATRPRRRCCRARSPS